MRAPEIPNVDQLSDLELLLLAEEILGSLRAPETLPAPLAHRLELDRRWTMHEADPANVLSKDQFRAKIAALKR